ncbi:MAG TPA: DCC1-like thiol-disulfide oxidoreductase family protein [Actinomycetota bacterium]
MDPAPKQLWVLYDETCAFCRRCCEWLATQPCRIPVGLLPAGSDEARQRFGAMPWLGEELIAVDERGRAWVGPAAFLTCLWATARYRGWSYRLSGPALAPLARRFFTLISKRRARWSGWVAGDADCAWCGPDTLIP